MKPSEFINESEYSHEEYDDEAGMVKTDIHTIVRVMTHLCKELKDDENIPEWCQEKIAQAKGMLVGVMDYMISQHEQGVQPHIAENASAGGTGSGAIAATPGMAGGKPKSQLGSLFGGTYTQKRSKKK